MLPNAQFAVCWAVQEEYLGFGGGMECGLVGTEFVLCCQTLCNYGHSEDVPRSGRWLEAHGLLDASHCSAGTKQSFANPVSRTKQIADRAQMPTDFMRQHAIAWALLTLPPTGPASAPNRPARASPEPAAWQGPAVPKWRVITSNVLSIFNKRVCF